MSEATPSLYFYMAGDERRGPFSFDQLLQQPVHRQTPVWCKGMSDWRPAQDLPAFSDLIPPPPPFNARAAAGKADELKRLADALYWLNFGILVLILGTFVLGMLTGNVFGVAYCFIALLWAGLMWKTAVATRASWPWLWAAAGVVPLVSYVPLIVLHGRLKRPLVAAGYRIGFFGRAKPPAGARA